MRTLLRTEAFDAFYSTLGHRAQEKTDYALALLGQLKVISTKFVKKLEGTIFYELRISTENEYRVILFATDSENIIEARTVILLNGFMKKSNKNYKAQICKAEMLLDKLLK